MTKVEKMSRLQRLMAAELYGTMTNEEGIELGKLLEEEWARKEWDTFHQRLDGVDLSEKIVQLLHQDAMDSKATTQKDNRILQIGAIAALIILVVLGGWAYLKKEPRAPKAADTGSVIHPPKDSLTTDSQQLK
jgi:transmembrane sensor